MKDMISAFEDSGFFDGQQITGPFNNTDDAIGPGPVLADGTWILVCQIKTNGAELDPFFDLYQTF